MGKKKGLAPPKEAEEYGRFKTLLSRIVSVPRQEVQEHIERHKARRAAGRRATSSR